MRVRDWKIAPAAPRAAPKAMAVSARGNRQDIKWFNRAETDAERQRVIVDQIASMTESRLERLARSTAEF